MSRGRIATTVGAAPRGRPSRRGAGLAALLALAVLCAACSPAPPAKTGAGAGQAQPFTPPEISLATPKEVRALIDAERGQVVVVNFWATWCPPCVKEMPELAKFWREFDGNGVKFLSVSADHHSTKDRAVVPFVNSYEIPFPIHVLYVDNPDEIVQDLPLTWEGRPWDGALPATFIFDRDGRQVWSAVGEVTRDRLAEKIAPFLSTTRE